MTMKKTISEMEKSPLPNFQSKIGFGQNFAGDIIKLLEIG